MCFEVSLERDFFKIFSLSLEDDDDDEERSTEEEEEEDQEEDGARTTTSRTTTPRRRSDRDALALSFFRGRRRRGRVKEGRKTCR